MQIRKIKDCFDKKLATIYQQIIALDELNKQVSQFLPPSLQKHCQVTQFHQGRLTLGLREVALATELRFFLPTLRDLLRQKAGLHQLSSLNIAIINQSDLAASDKPTKPLSRAAQLAISEASAVCEFKPLQQAWEKMIHLKRTEK